jgi:ATP-dependent Lon protease
VSRIEQGNNLRGSKLGDWSIVVAIRDAVHFPRLINTLHVGRESSLKAVRRSLELEVNPLVLSQRDMNVEDPQAGDLCTIGTISEILSTTSLPDATLRVALRGKKRAKVVDLKKRDGVFYAKIEPIEESSTDSPQVEALMRECVELLAFIVEKGQKAPPEALQAAMLTEDGGLLADLIAHHLPLRPNQKQEVLEKSDILERLQLVHDLLTREKAMASYQIDLRTNVQNRVMESQKEFFLREQLKSIQSQLQGADETVKEIVEYRERIEKAGLRGEALARAQREVEKLDRTPSSTPEGVVLRNYLDWLVSLPWDALTEDHLDIEKAHQVLESRHYGLESVKERILDYLAARQLSPDLRGAVLCFVGPPGVGKTSLGNSIADALGRRFVSVSVGGLRDEAELRGHRRTYVGALPGRLIQALRQCGTRNPVFMLDEIDKIGFDMRGDPAGALLEALDPNQNSGFSDHFIETPFDLSSVLFIATANVVDTIPAALRDRLEVIEFSSYTREERVELASRFLIPNQIDVHGLNDQQIAINPDAIDAIVDHYTYEAGVRDLERQIATVCRKSARRIVEHKESVVTVTESNLIQFLGQPKYRLQSDIRADEIGAATGLVVSYAGGDIITIEVSLLEPVTDQPQITLTGNLGNVMKESAHAAVTYVRSILGTISPGSSSRYDIHMHIPEGAISKDGPSAGLTIAVTLASAFTNRAVRGDVAMTGEITLRGRVLPIGGLREKALAAQRSGVKHIIIPQANAPEIESLPLSTREAVTFHPVSMIQEAIDFALLPQLRAVVRSGVADVSQTVE